MERRIEIRITPADALWPVLGELSGRQRNALARALLEAALLPGGWAAQAEEGYLGLRTVAELATEQETESPAPDAGSQNFLAALRQFGALDD